MLIIITKSLLIMQNKLFRYFFYGSLPIPLEGQEILDFFQAQHKFLHQPTASYHDAETQLYHLIIYRQMEGPKKLNYIFGRL